MTGLLLWLDQPREEIEEADLLFVPDDDQEKCQPLSLVDEPTHSPCRGENFIDFGCFGSFMESSSPYFRALQGPVGSMACSGKSLLGFSLNWERPSTYLLVLPNASEFLL